MLYYKSCDVLKRKGSIWAEFFYDTYPVCRHAMHRRECQPWQIALVGCTVYHCLSSKVIHRHQLHPARYTSRVERGRFCFSRRMSSLSWSYTSRHRGWTGANQGQTPQGRIHHIVSYQLDAVIACSAPHKYPPLQHYAPGAFPSILHFFPLGERYILEIATHDSSHT